MSRYRLTQRLALPALAPAAAIDAVVAQPFRVPSFARDYTVHDGDAVLARALRPLQGKFSIVNPRLVLPLPPAVRDRLARRLVAPAPAVCLYECVEPTVRHDVRELPSTMPGRDIRFWAELRYRVALADVDPAALAACPSDGPCVEWFRVLLLVPDAIALAQMAPASAHFYRYVTGRLGAQSSDCYWYLDAWERFGEQGQVLGCLAPSFVQHGHVGGAVRDAAKRDPADSSADDFDFGGGSGEPSRFAPYSDRFDRRGFVPPGYCLIQYLASVDVVARSPGADVAA